MATLMSKDQFLAELKKRKEELRVFLSRLAEAKSDSEISDFRYQVSADAADSALTVMMNQILRDRSLANQIAANAVLGSVVASQFWISGDGIQNVIGPVAPTDTKAVIKRFYEQLPAAYNDMFPNIRNYILARLNWTLDFVKKIQDNYKEQKDLIMSMPGDEDSKRQGLYALNVNTGKDVYTTTGASLSAFDPTDYEKAYYMMGNVGSDVNLIPSVLSLFDKYISQIENQVKEITKFYTVKLKADAVIAQAEADLESYSQSVKNFLDLATSDSGLKDLVPSWEKFLADAKEAKATDVAKAGLAPAVVEGKKTNWLLVGGAALAAAYLMGN